MITLKNTYSLKPSKRKILAGLMLAIAFSNFPVSSAHAAGPATQSDLPAFVQVVDVVAPASTSTQPEIETVPAVQPTVQEVLLSVCKENGYGEDCAKTLLGMLWNESSNISTAIGDHGKARGYFQIHYKLHKITTDCAEDLVCSANWTINYMEAHSYPKYVSYAIQCHNSCGVNNGYAAKAVRNSKLMWDKPLTITQAAPIEIAVK